MLAFWSRPVFLPKRLPFCFPRSGPTCRRLPRFLLVFNALSLTTMSYLCRPSNSSPLIQSLFQYWLFYYYTFSFVGVCQAPRALGFCHLVGWSFVNPLSMGFFQGPEPQHRSQVWLPASLRPQGSPLSGPCALHGPQPWGQSQGWGWPAEGTWLNYLRYLLLLGHTFTGLHLNAVVCNFPILWYLLNFCMCLNTHLIIINIALQWKNIYYSL